MPCFRSTHLVFPACTTSQASSSSSPGQGQTNGSTSSHHERFWYTQPQSNPSSSTAPHSPFGQQESATRRQGTTTAFRLYRDTLQAAEALRWAELKKHKNINHRITEESGLEGHWNIVWSHLSWEKESGWDYRALCSATSWKPPAKGTPPHPWEAIPVIDYLHCKKIFLIIGIVVSNTYRGFFSAIFHHLLL